MAKRGGFPGAGAPGNMNNLMKQAQKMQKQMADLQENLDTQLFEATVGGGVLTVTVNGKKELTTVKIKPEAVDPDDVEMLEDLIVAAVNEAVRKADEAVNAQMSKFTGGMNLPGGLF
jgi:nucleoid-associated protein EbfC